MSQSDSVKRSPEASAARHLAILEAVRQTPGAAAAGFSSNVPGSTWVSTPEFELLDGMKLPSGVEGVLSNEAGPGWFEAVGMRILSGRSFERRDVTSPDPRTIAVVNETFARRFLKGTPVGQVVWNVGYVSQKTGLHERFQVEIVGVVQDATFLFVREAPPPTIYFPLIDQTLGQLSVRTAGPPPIALKSAVAEAISRIEPNTVLTFRTLADQMSAQYTRERLTAMLSGFFAGLALLLAAIGIYGVTAYAVVQRRAEIGIRMALGAVPKQVVALMMRRVATPGVIGIVAGMVVTVWLSRFASALLYGVTPGDIPTFVGAVLVLVLVIALAGWLPAQRASKVHPSEVLRES